MMICASSEAKAALSEGNPGKGLREPSMTLSKSTHCGDWRTLRGCPSREVKFNVFDVREFTGVAANLTPSELPPFSRGPLLSLAVCAPSKPAAHEITHSGWDSKQMLFRTVHPRLCLYSTRARYWRGQSRPSLAFQIFTRRESHAPEEPYLGILCSGYFRRLLFWTNFPNE
jgi:hypothetical protein